MTNQIVAQTVTEVDVNALRATWDAAVEAERAARTSGDLDAVVAASRAERVANAAWKAGEKALQAMWRDELAADEEARLQAMCEAYEAMEEDYGAFDDHAYYTVTDAGYQYLDHHYAQHSNA